jgi:hypothetical protein
MCCPLILCRKKTISRAEGPNRMTRSTKERTKRWHDKRIRKKECDIGDKVFMNSSSKGNFKQEEKTTISHLPFIT